MPPAGRTRTRRSVLGAVGAVAAAGLAGHAARSAHSDGGAGQTGGGRAPPSRGGVGLVLYNHDDASREAVVSVTEGDRTLLGARRVLDPGEAAEFEDAIPRPSDATQFGVAVDIDGGTTARRTVLLGPPHETGEVHAVIRGADRIDLSVVA